MELVRGLTLGAVQGLTEFFPVSSSGHLILVPILFHWPDQGTAFDTVLHLGTLVALFWFFRNDLIDLVKKKNWLFISKVIVAAIPALIVGYFLNDWISANVRQAWIVAADTAFWAIILFWADRTASKRKTSLEDYEKITWTQAIAIGFAQILALAPGTSRSGITITTGLFTGLNRQAAARFSFMLSIPVTAAAGAHGLLDVYKHGAGAEGPLALAVGFVAALAFGLFAIRFLLSYVAKNHYDGFVIYRLILACVVLLLA